MVDLLSFFAFIFLFLIVFTIHWYVTIPKNLPPGPLGLPFLGNAIDYHHGSTQSEVVMGHIKKYGPLYRLYIGGKLVIILGDFDCIQEAVVKQGNIFSGRPRFYSVMVDKLHKKGLAFSEGDLWREHRRFALATFRDFGMGRPVMEPRIKEEIEHMVECLQEYASSGCAFDPQNVLTSGVSNIISQLIFGHRFDYDDPEFVDQFTKLAVRDSNSDVGMLSPFVLSGTLAMLASASSHVRNFNREEREFCDYVERNMKETIKTFDPLSEPNNYIHAYQKFVAENSNDSFSELQLLASVYEMFAAGTSTISNTIRYGILLLAYNPEVQEKMVQELKEQIGTCSLPNYADRVKLPYCEAVTMEVQRRANLFPAGVVRTTLENTKLMGYDIPEGAVVIAFLTNVLLNPKLFPNPDEFNPNRFLDDHGKVIRDPNLIPYGAGKRICLGESLARMELFLLLVGCISRFRFYFADGQAKPSLKPYVGLLSAPAPYKVYVENRGD